MRKIVTIRYAKKGWRIKSSWASRAHKICETQAEAFSIGKRIAMKNKCDLYLYRRDHSLQSLDRFDEDPFPPRGK